MSQKNDFTEALKSLKEHIAMLDHGLARYDNPILKVHIKTIYEQIERVYEVYQIEKHDVKAFEYFKG